MKIRTGKRRSWQFYLVVGAFLVGVFSVVDHQVFPNMHASKIHLPTFGLQSQNTLQSSSTQADSAASNQVVSALTQAVGNVDGLNDMAVLPDGKGTGQFLVSAVVDLSTVAGVSTSNMKQAMQGMVDKYFADVYSVGASLSQAEITFTLDGNIVGSAGLGKTAYTHLASSTMSGDLSQAIQSTAPVDNNSSKDIWFQVQAN